MDSQYKYVIVGSSHAGLAALKNIRIQDPEGSIALITREDALPYSPTILPYVLSGQIEPDNISLLNESDLMGMGVVFLRNKTLARINTHARGISLASGETLRYEKLLLATGAEPTAPPIAGLENTPYHVLRTVDDTLRLRNAARQRDSAVILGAGLIGMHACESLAEEGLNVTVIESMPQILRGYFDEESSDLIRRIFLDHDVKIILQRDVNRASMSGDSPLLSLHSGEEISSGLLLISTGMRPRMEYLAGSGIEADEGIVVDERMRTSVEGVWAAGDVAKAPDFFTSEKSLMGTLLNAVEQGRIAGMGMADDPALVSHAGGIRMNTYKFFGHRAISAGLIHPLSPDESLEERKMGNPDGRGYLKLFFREDRLMGFLSIDFNLDPGIMCELIRRRVDLRGVKEDLTNRSQDIGRVVMNRIWR
ncbi:MAG: NADH-dependent phenylglyoxylate dehydrogenase subunit epsilon [Pseudomonadota bacterium]